MYLGARENSQKLYCCTQAAIIYHKPFFYKKNIYILLHLSQQLKYISKSYMYNAKGLDVNVFHLIYTR